jgi:adenine deaminase
MATINTARCYHLKDIGAIAPGYDADLVIVDNLNDFTIEEVYKDGVLVGKDRQPLFELKKVSTKSVENTMKRSPVSSDIFKLPLQSDVANVIRISPGSIVTEHVIRRVYQDEDHNFTVNPMIDVVKLAVIERHGKKNTIGLGLVENFHLKNGAIASSIAHDSHNIIVVGSNDEDMKIAVNKVIEMDGGIALASEGLIKGKLPLKIAGLMSDLPMERVSENLNQLRLQAKTTLGIPEGLEPFMTLSFLALPVIPELKLTDQGYFDVLKFKHIDVDVK